MIFSEDAILLTLLERYEDEQDVKDAVLSYCARGAVTSSAQKRPTQEQQKGTQALSSSEGDVSTASDIDMASSPSDSALDFMKRKRLNQMAAKQQQ